MCNVAQVKRTERSPLQPNCSEQDGRNRRRCKQEMQGEGGCLKNCRRATEGTARQSRNQEGPATKRRNETQKIFVTSRAFSWPMRISSQPANMLDYCGTEQRHGVSPAALCGSMEDSRRAAVPGETFGSRFLCRAGVTSRPTLARRPAASQGVFRPDRRTAARYDAVCVQPECRSLRHCRCRTAVPRVAGTITRVGRLRPIGAATFDCS